MDGKTAVLSLSFYCNCFLCDLYCVHCRTGSLEMKKSSRLLLQSVHCRTGSLETSNRKPQLYPSVHCRTGSLES